MTLFIVAFIYFLLCLFSIRKFRKVLNPFILETYLVFLMIPLPQLLKIMVGMEETSFFYSDLAILVYVVFIFLGSMTNLSAIRIREIHHISIVNFTNWGFFFLFLLPIIPMFLSFGFSISGIRNFYETVVFSRYASFFELSKFFLYAILIYKLVSMNRISWSVWIWTPFFFLYGSKFVVFDFFMLLLLFQEYYRNLSYKKFFLASMTVAVLLVAYRYLQTPDGGEDVLSNSLSYFDQYKNQSFLINKFVSGDATYYHGWIYISSYLKYIPRFLWENKPRDFGFAIINWDFMPVEAASGYMPAFGLGSLFADFGYYGLAFTGFFIGLLKRYLYNVFVKSRNNLSFFLFALPFTMLSFLLVVMNLWVDQLVKTFTKTDEPKNASN